MGRRRALAAQPVGNGSEQLVALGFRVGLQRRLEVGDPSRQTREQARQLAGVASEPARQSIVRRAADEVFERVDEGLERGANTLVAPPVEHRPIARCASRAASAASRVLPIPGSPETSSTREVPSSTVRRWSSTKSSSAARPANQKSSSSTSKPGSGVRDSCAASCAATAIAVVPSSIVTLDGASNSKSACGPAIRAAASEASTDPGDAASRSAAASRTIGVMRAVSESDPSPTAMPSIARRSARRTSAVHIKVSAADAKAYATSPPAPWIRRPPLDRGEVVKHLASDEHRRRTRRRRRTPGNARRVIRLGSENLEVELGLMPNDRGLQPAQRDVGIDAEPLAQAFTELRVRV